MALKQFQDAGVAVKPGPNEFQRADEYRAGERIVSKFTRRTGVVAAWPEYGVLPVIGALWIHWDDGQRGHAYRHQINRA